MKIGLHFSGKWTKFKERNLLYIFFFYFLVAQFLKDFHYMQIGNTWVRLDQTEKGLQITLIVDTTLVP